MGYTSKFNYLGLGYECILFFLPYYNVNIYAIGLTFVKTITLFQLLNLKKMKFNTLLFTLTFCLSSFTFQADAQVQTPQLSPECDFKQTVGLTDVSISYSRPSMRGRVIFGNVVPYNEVWRLGANKNTTIEVSQEIYFNLDTLSKGTYALFTIPGKESWELVFYTESTNWGTPDKWDESKVALRLKSKVKPLKTAVQTLTIEIEDLNTAGANFSISWGRVKLSFPFQLMTKKQVVKSIDELMSGPTSSDYYRAAKYYLNEDIDHEKALVWINKAVDMRGVSAYWMTRVQAELFAANGRYKEAITSAQLSMKSASKEGDSNYVRLNEESIAKWIKMK
mgnify:FL=1|tara:strand:+ start:35160 stop:36167 length:1008 start_codon:yes stop_codon:yes gene_type:complete